MGEKSYVTMEQKVCPICGKTFDTGALLLDRRLRNTFERNTVTGLDLCPEHTALHKDGFVALVAVDESKSERMPNGNLQPEGAWRTGKIAHLKREAWDRVFNCPAPDARLPFVYCDDDTVELLARKQQEAEGS